ncbi:hypothetical protein BBJ28_00007155 [Nothophytophthora sp. Chile5]|nr:hypothetical protein BBJ28_00007155 [Nothophytophthora sp. Chile5]
MPPHRQLQLQLEGLEPFLPEDEQSLPSLAQQLPPVADGCSRLYLCRHGQTEYNRLHKFQGRGVNTALNDEGLSQAKYLAQAMRDVPLRAIYSSALRRAHETAEAVATLHPKLEVQPFHDLEEMSFGVLEGNPHEMYEDQVLSIFQQWEHGDFAARFPNGECPLDVVARGVSKIDALLAATPPKEQVLMVTHGRFNKVVLAQLLHGELTHMQEIEQDNTCVNVVDFEHATHSYHAMALNNTNHLPTSPAV